MGGGDPFVGMLLAVGFNFAPPGWLLCNGSLYAISQYNVLFTLLGTTFGGDGINNFGVPDLRGRTPIHFGTDPSGNQYPMGQLGGAEQVTLNANQMPTHNHTVMANSNTQNTSSPNNNYLAAGQPAYKQNVTPSNTFAANSISNTGGSLPHNNLQPFLTINWLIAFSGVFPSQ